MADKTLKSLNDITTASAVSDSDITYTVRPSTDTDYKISLGDLKTYMAPSKPQIVATHNAIATGLDAGNDAGRTDLQKHHRMAHFTGCQDVDQLQMGMGAYCMQPATNTGETPLGNGFTWEAGFEYSGLTRIGPVNGKFVNALDDKCSLVLTDPVGFTIPAGTLLVSRQGFINSDVGDNFLNYTVNRMYNSVCRRSPLVASQVPNTGPFTVISGSSLSYRGTTPFVILGIPKKPMASVLVIGDSIADGVGDSQTFGTYGGIGFIRRGLEQVNGYSVPWHFQAVSGWAMTGQARNLSPRTRDTWKYCTHAIFELGWNDVGAGDSFTIMQAKAIAALTELKATIGPYGKPLHVTITTITPGTTSSNSFINAAGQTARAGFENSGVRDQYNSWLRSLPGGGLVDAIIDIAAITEDASDHTKFKTNGGANWPTTDGIHPSANLVNLMSPLVNTWAQGIKP